MNKAILALLVSLPLIGHAQGTAFVYQGRLNDNGAAANGSYDLRLTVYDAGTNGNALAATTNAATSAVNGLFAVTLDFGAGTFNGSARWLEIAARTNGSVGAFTVLSPRQSVTGSPYAIMAGNISGVVANSSLLGTYTNPVTFNNAANSLGGDASALTALNASQLTAGVVPAAALTNAWRIGGNSGTVAGTHFIGTTDLQPLEFRVNNLRMMRLEASGANVIVGAANTISNIGGGCTVSGGGLNMVFGEAGTISGGRANVISNAVNPNGYSTISGGLGNIIGATNQYDTIGGGFDNRILASGIACTVFGGCGNRIYDFGNACTISGGWGNVISNNNIYATIGGGWANLITSSSDLSFIGGGYWNMARGATSVTIAGGYSNIVQKFANNSTIGGGFNNLVVSNAGNATIPGGRFNVAAGSSSFAAGQQAKAMHSGAFVWADSTDAPFSSTTNDQFCIRANGGVGIGTGAPGEALEVSAPDCTIRVRNTNDTGGGFIGNTYAALQFGIYNPSVTTFGVVPPGGKASFFGIENHGKVGSISSPFGSPTFRNLLDDGNGGFSFSGNGYLNNTTVYFRGDNNHGVGWFGTGGPVKTFAGIGPDGPILFGYGGGALGTEQNGTEKIALRWDGSQHVAIASLTNNTSYNLYVNGTAGGTSAYQNLSDARLKKNISQLNNALEKVMKLRGVSFDWCRDEHPEMNFEKQRQVGFIAQEVKEVLPEAVQQDGNGVFSLAYTKVIPLLVEAMKEQTKKSDALAKEKDAKISALEQRLAALEQLVAKQLNTE
jgi:hypothetical protein